MSDSNILSNFLQWIYFSAKIAGGLVLVMVTMLYINQDKMLYMPNPPGIPRTPTENPKGFNSPSDWGINGNIARMNPSSISKIEYEEFFIQTKDQASIHTWLLLQSNSKEVPTIIFFHGNAGNMGFRLKMAAQMFATTKCNILMMDYRGYGSSIGSPYEEGLNIDADAVLMYANTHPKLKNDQIIAYGQSLGGAVAISMAHRHPSLVAGVILENTFTSISGMVDVIMPFLKPIKSFVLNMKWNSDEKISLLKMPILFMSGDSDELVPTAHMRILHEKANTTRYKEFYSIYGGTHNDSSEIAGLEYYKRMANFVENQIIKVYSITPSAIIDISDDDGYYIVNNVCTKKSDESIMR